MTVRVLIIDEQEPYRRLLAQHVSTGFEEPTIVEYDPAARGPLPADFSGSAYDVVLLADTTGGAPGLEWLRDLARRHDFPPVIYLLSEPEPAQRDEALAAGALACLSKRKVDHGQLVAVLRAAQARRGQPAAAPAPLRADDAPRLSRFGDFTIRGYRFVSQLAETPVSTVYLAVDERSGGEVVLKVLRRPPENAGGTATFDRFLKEYQIAAAIVHPNIVRIHDFGVSDDQAFIVMEYFPRGDLRAQIKAGIAPLQALRYLRQMAEALQILHTAGVLHRDLKPGNVMLRDDSTLVLIDYGLSKQLELETAITGSGEIFGTPYYMSPEQGHGRPTDERSDIYSLGIIFYEMLMRRKPYVAGTSMQVIYKHANSPLPELPPELKRFEPILFNCIAKDPQRRYLGVDGLLDAVRELERDELERTGAARA
ncbi:MAG: serine/threonine protein kinase [Gammaproteobacteria bacterium]|nr:serine/threonine protein kinase [Gammaproteobacteria bacterium]